MNIFYYALVSMCVSFCIGIMLNAKIKIAVLGAVLGGACYSIFMLCGSYKLGYFTGTLVLAILSELMAKKIKTPTTLFLIIGIYPLVPGSGIFKTIMLIIEADYSQALKMGGDTFVYISLMTTAMAIVSIAVGKTSEEKFEKHRSLQSGLFVKGGDSLNGKNIY